MVEDIDDTLPPTLDRHEYGRTYFNEVNRLGAKEMRMFSSGQVCRLLGPADKPLPFQTLNSWVVQKIITPARESTGTGQQRLFSAVQVLAISLGRGLRHGAFKAGLDVSGDVMEVVMSHTEEAMLKKFADGRKYIAIDNSKNVSRKLLSRDECQKIAAKSALVGDVIPPVVVDVEAAWNRMIELVEAMEAEQKKESAK
jgi:hypothetical protein